MEKNSNRLAEQMAFILEVDKEKKIMRQTYLSDSSRKENDAEHSWHLAMMVMLLSEYSNEKIDVLHTMSMVLIHDLVEIDAGDTYAYDEVGNSTKKQREEAAANRIFGLLPKDQADSMRKLWDEFEENTTAEARFANTMDKVQPLMLNNASEGKAWLEHGIHASQVYARNEKTKDGSNELWKYSDENYIKPNIQKKILLED